MQAELIRNPNGLAELEEEWRELAVARGNPFVTPEWFQSWWRHYGDDHWPLVGVVRDQAGSVRGVLPLVATSARRWPTIRFAGSSLGDHFHPAAAPEDDTAVARAVGVALSGEVPRPTLVLENVDADASWWQELSRSAGCGGRPLVDRHTTMPRVELEGRTWEEYLAGRSRNFRSQVRRKRRALERQHAVRFRWSDASDRVGADVTTLFRLHDMRWRQRQGTSSLADEEARAFHTEFAELAARQGWLRLCFLEVDEEPVAGWYGWKVGGRFAYYQAGFNPAWQDHSVGFVLLAETIRVAADEGATEYDMLLGEEYFKSRFADSSRQVCSILIAPRSRPLRMVAAAEVKLRSVGRRVPERYGAAVKRHGRLLLDRLPLARRR